MSGNISLCSFCRYIPLDVETLEKLRAEARPRSALGGSRAVPLDMRDKKDLAARDRASLRKTEFTVRDRFVFALGKAERVLSSDCPFCKITAIAVRDIKRVVGWQDLKADTPLTLTWSHKGPGSKGLFRVNDKRDVYICFAEQGCNDPSTKDSTACLIRPTQAHLDPSSVTRWIADCERLHGPKCNAHNDISGPVRDAYRGLELMRFVDVNKMCIVESREVVKYVALSYVWGATPTLRLTAMNQHRMRFPGALKGLPLPNTIEDALDLTRACGEQFLWVDSLCIVQNDVEDLEAGTYAMDLICKSASP